MRTLPARTTLGVNFWIAASFCHNKDTLSPKNDQRLLAHLHAPGSHQSSLNKGSDGVTDKARQWSDLDPTKTIMITIWWEKPWWIWYDDNSVMVQKTVIITIWWQNRDDYDMMTVQGWGLTPGRAPATRPPLPPTLSATRPAQIVFLHSCSSVFVTSKNCISSLTLKCICVPKKRPVICLNIL